MYLACLPYCLFYDLISGQTIFLVRMKRYLLEGKSTCPGQPEGTLLEP